MRTRKGKSRSFALIYTLALATNSIFGIPAAHAASCAPTATDIQLTGVTYRVLAFTSAGSCDWTTPSGITSIDQLVVAGGGGGGSAITSGSAGGGGGGQVISLTGQSVTANTLYSIVVGDGGTSPTTVVAGGTGGSSSFNGSAASGGGGGASPNSTNAIAGATGGYAGGGGASQAVMVTNGATGASGYSGGNGQANSSDANLQSGGGGAGAGGNGTNGTTSTAGTGGNGLPSSLLTGTNQYYGGGGGGGKRMAVTGPGAGTHGGGNGGQNGTAGSAGAANSGSGGGGGAGQDCCTNRGGAGGSGLVAVRYAIMSGVSAFTGNSNVGATFTADLSGITSPVSTTPIYQWQIATTSNGAYSDISGATSSTYSISTSDKSKFIRLKITARDAYGTSTTFLNSSPSQAIGNGTPILYPSIAGGAIEYRVPKVVTLGTNSLSGKVKFFANGRVIPGCINVVSNAGNSYSATCSWKPALHGRITITATFKPDDANYNQSSSSYTGVVTNKRSTYR